MGIIALVLVKVQIPSMLKFIILSITTFAISNMIIYSYQKTIQKKINMKIIATTVIVALLLGTAFYSPTSATNEIAGTTVSQSEISIHEAVITGNLEAVKQYIKAGKDLNIKESMGGSTALTTAAVFGKTEIALALIDAGADVNIKNNAGSTALESVIAPYSAVQGIYEYFYEATDYEMECNKICGRHFKTIDEHTEFIKNGGCDKLIEVLARS